MQQSEEHSVLQFYKVMAIPTLLYGSETWPPRKQEYRQTNPKLHLQGCTRLDYIRNEAIRKQLNVKPITNLIKAIRTDGRNVLSICSAT